MVTICKVSAVSVVELSTLVRLVTLSTQLAYFSTPPRSKDFGGGMVGAICTVGGGRERGRGYDGAGASKNEGEESTEASINGKGRSKWGRSHFGVSTKGAGQERFWTARGEREVIVLFMW